MFKKVALHALIGGVVFVLGACLHDFVNMKYLGDLLAYGGMAYAGIATILILFSVRIPIFLVNAKKNASKKKAQEELMRYKKLLS